MENDETALFKLDEQTKSYEISERLNEPEYKVFYRKVSRSHTIWPPKGGYLSACTCAMIGISNISKFPACLIKYGTIYLLVYFILCISITLPILSLEMLVGQLGHYSPAKSFQCVPLFIGLGWSMICFGVVVLIIQNILLVWTLMYFFNAFSIPFPWVICTNVYNTPDCNPSNTNNNTSYEEFWLYYVTKFRAIGSKENLPFSLSPKAPDIMQIYASGIIWVLIFLCIAISTRKLVKFFFLIIVYVLIILLLLFIINIQKMSMKTVEQLRPKLDVLTDASLYIEALLHVIYSTALGTGTIINFVSFNQYYTNVIKDSAILISIDWFFGILSGFAIYQSFLNIETKDEFTSFILSHDDMRELFSLVTLVDGVSFIPNIWCVSFLLMVITLQLANMVSRIYLIYIGVKNLFGKPERQSIVGLVIIGGLCSVGFAISILTVPAVGMYWFIIIQEITAPMYLLCILLFETVVLGIFYGPKRLSKAFKFISQYDAPFLWLYYMVYVIPIILIISIIYFASQLRAPIIYDQQLPNSILAIGIVFVVLTCIPIIVGMIYSYRKLYLLRRSDSFSKIIKQLLKVPMINWEKQRTGSQRWIIKRSA